ncbi:ABC transporter ATP-binding protein [Microtetraspora malaysiensis]|uniref:ABC transporter ATP-binding protein n=1 Tax=Microtetraspora malaysiensis TaxID=161358 RepID=UPI003D8F4C01
MSHPVLEVRDLRKVYPVTVTEDCPDGAFTALHRESFTLAPGGSLAVVGESGSGKTTCARLIVGLERPTSGTVLVDGVERGRARMNTTRRRQRGREVQIVFQDPYSSLDPRQRVRDCLAEVLTLHFDMDARERVRRVGELIDQVGLDERQAGALPRALSGGQRQRVAIARALAAEPKVLILDEAVAALDVSIQAQVLNVLADVREATGVAYLFITHDLAVVQQVCDDVVVMRSGRIVERGTVADVLERPAHPYTRRLLASVPRPGWTPRRRTTAGEPPASTGHPPPPVSETKEPLS